MRGLPAFVAALASIIAVGLAPNPAAAQIPVAGTSTLAYGSTFEGRASWYGAEFKGRKPASGEIYDP